MSAIPMPLVPQGAREQILTGQDDAVVRRSVLPGGVRVLSEVMPHLRSATIGCWVGVGSRDEADGHHGSTHFLEHLLFKGTARRSAMDIATVLDRVGGEANAATGKEHTCYYARVRDADLPLAVDVLLDMVTSARLDRADVESERGVIHHYDPPGLVITAAGGVDHDLLCEQVTRELDRSGWHLAADAEPRARRPVGGAPATAPGGSLLVTRSTEQANVVLGTRGLVATDPRRHVMSVLNAVLGGGMSSRLFQEIRELRGLAYSVYSFATGYSDAGYFGLYAGCMPAKIDEVLGLLGSGLDTLAADGITAEELERAHGQLCGSLVLGLEDTGSRMTRLGKAELVHGEFLTLEESLRRVRAVTADDVAALASDLASRPRSLTVVGSFETGRIFEGV
ncbi:MAG: insulinase family protein [Kineosporiaceae bacterium]|nr:insulinase family protein [Kineosporiaceae bacterium]